mmetsp:Transcript_100406/g.199246  ORF Transcript_100406/g.199246 Transcript_100406/m.199246 type:complete len:435 (-) Transcript_100406:37-1341(-)
MEEATSRKLQPVQPVRLHRFLTASGAEPASQALMEARGLTRNEEGRELREEDRFSRAASTCEVADTCESRAAAQQMQWLARGHEDWREEGAARVPMAVSVTVLLYAVIAYNVVYLRRVLPKVGKEACVIPYFCLYNITWGLAIWSYIQAHMTDPGSVPKRWQEFVLTVGDALPIAPARAEWQPGKATYCQKCRQPRPERAHHCAICGMCVLRMDHHCPWINNCVGFNNHKFFLLVGIYCCLLSLIGMVTSFVDLFICIVSLLRLEHLFPVEDPELTPVDILVLFVFGGLSMLFFLLLCPMVLSHLPLAQRNETTIEHHYDNMPNPFDQQNTFANISQLFGDFGPDWLLPIMPRRPITDGVSFPRADEKLGSSRSISLMGEDDEPETERIWRSRYNVRASAISPTSSKMIDTKPVPFFSRWWAGVDAGTRRIISL